MPRYATGQKVRVLELEKPGHVRTPFYIRRQIGHVIQFCGVFLNPEDLAIGNTAGPVVECYRVEFQQCEIWDAYEGQPDDTIVIEVYAHWMEPFAGEGAHV